MIVKRLLAALLLAATLLSGCGAATPPPPAALAAETAAPPSPTIGSGRPLFPTLAPATTAPRTPSVQPTAVPTAAPTIPPPTATPAFYSTTAPGLIDVAAQRAALLPEYAGDLDGAERWDRYRIEAVLDPAALTISGTLAMAVRNGTGEPFDALYFHLYPNHPDFGGTLEVADVRIGGQPVATGSEQGGVLLRVNLPQPLPPGSWAELSMRFEARTRRNASGRAYGAFNQEAGVWALAGFYPTLARYLPGAGWDRRPVISQGDFAVTVTGLYDVSLRVPAGWELATTGVQVEQQALEGGLRRERFVSGPQRDFFIAAIQGLERASTVVDGTRVVAFYQSGNRAAGERSLAVAEQSLRGFNTRYGRYPLAEMEVIQAALTTFLGVEYPGIMLIEQNLYRRNTRGLETTVAHEVAHQWWYSQVGNDYQGEPWLDEGLASFSQIVYYEQKGDQAAAEAELASFRASYLAAREAGRDGAVNRPVGAFRGNYVALVYAKAALFFQALRERIGEEAFAQFIKSYYATYRYREATGPELRTVAEAACGCDLKEFYRAWIETAARVELP